MTGRAGVLFAAAILAVASTCACAGKPGAATGPSSAAEKAAVSSAARGEDAAAELPVPMNQTVSGTPSKEECGQYFKTECSCEITVRREPKGGCRVTLGLSTELLTIDVSKRIPKGRSAVMCGRLVRCD